VGTQFAVSAFPLNSAYHQKEKHMASTTRKTKSMLDKDGERKLAAGAGRKRQKRAGEPQKDSPVPRGSARRTGSSKQRKG
jgi:hypothetical protein